MENENEEALAFDLENVKTEISEEDADAFAVSPLPFKFQNQDADEYEAVVAKAKAKTDYANSEDVDTYVVKCMICNKPSKIWAKKHTKQVSTFAESLCKLLTLPNIPYEMDFQEADYCRTCQQKMVEIHQLVKKLEILQQTISDTRVEIEGLLCDSSRAVGNLDPAWKLEVEVGHKKNFEIRRKLVKKLGLSITFDVEPEPEVEVPKSLQPELIPEPVKVKLALEEDFYEHEHLGEPDGDGDDWIPSNDDDDDSDSDVSFEPDSVKQTFKRKKINNSDIPKKRMCTRSRNSKAKVSSDAEVDVEEDNILIVKVERLTQNEFDGLNSEEKTKTKAKRSKPVKKLPEPKSQNRKRGPPTKNTKTKSKRKMITAILSSDEGEDEDTTGNLETGKKLFQCTLCNRKHGSQQQVDAHVKRYHEGKSHPYECDVEGCTKSFLYGAQLDVHKMTHAGETPFICDYCAKSFRTFQSLTLHQQNKHIEGARKVKCPHCDMCFINENKLRLHLVKHTKVYPFMCQFCGKGFVSKNHLETHILGKHKGKDNPFKCDYENCGKTFTSPANLKGHQAIHTGNYPFRCPECNQGMMTTTCLKRHLSKHAPEKQFKCEICPATFTYEYSILKHMMSHRGEKKFKCPDCDKSFIDNYKLTRHRKIHTGERPYQCDICHKCFYTKDYLNIHKSYHNKAIEQGKKTINEAKIQRILKPGVSGARSGSGSIKSKSKPKSQTSTDTSRSNSPTPTPTGHTTAGNDNGIGQNNLNNLTELTLQKNVPTSYLPNMNTNISTEQQIQNLISNVPVSNFAQATLATQGSLSHNEMVFGGDFFRVFP